MIKPSVENGITVFRDERGFLIKNEHTEEDKLHRLLESQTIDDIKLALTIVEKKKKDLDLLYLFDMVRVEEGYFKMGEKKRLTYIKEAYYLCKYTITQGLWTAIMGSNPANHQGSTRLPIENITWEQFEAFLSRLNAITGLPFKLPTEAQWEYAADGGHKMPLDENGEPIEDIYSGFSDINEIDKYAWYSNNSGRHTHEVGLLLPNKLGIYDMTGNVFEWCVDEI